MGLLMRTLMTSLTGPIQRFSWSHQVLMKSVLITHSVNISSPQEPSQNLQLAILKYIYLNFETSGKGKERKRARTEKSQEINCHELNVASSFKAKVLSLNNSPAWSDRQSHQRWCSVPVHSSAGTLTRWAGVSSSVRCFADGTAALFLTRWDSSRALQRFSQSTPPCMKNAHNWHNLPLPPRATQWRSKYRGKEKKKKALKTLFLLFVQ